jgi:hypothetical protein
MEVSLEQLIIDGALKIISDPKRWTRYHDAENAEGRPCGTCASQAQKFCAQGAIYRAAYDLNGHTCTAFANSAINAVGRVSEDLVMVNDGANGRRRVIKIFEQALKNLRA